MKISERRIENFLDLVLQTSSIDTSCGDCCGQLAEFVENRLAGKTAQQGLDCVDRHLQQCCDCREEFTALRDALEQQTQVPHYTG